MNLGQLQIARQERTGTITPRYAVLTRKEPGQTAADTSRLHVYDLQQKKVIVTFIGLDKAVDADEACSILNKKTR